MVLAHIYIGNSSSIYCLDIKRGGGLDKTATIVITKYMANFGLSKSEGGEESTHVFEAVKSITAIIIGRTCIVFTPKPIELQVLEKGRIIRN